jgi:arylsulfatase A-like enzyme
VSVPPHARGYENFGGRVGRTVAESSSWWPPAPRPPAGTPNIIVVLLDDMGFSDIGPFGAEIDTPVLDGIAATGVRLTNYHTTPVCSPARAALLTGLNPHRAGFASVANSDPGFPNLTLELADDVWTLPEILRTAGYATFAVGKWHLTRDALMHDGAPKHTWPLQRGFDRYYGTLEGCNSFFHPNRLIRDNSPVDIEDFPDGYYLTDDLTDQAIAMLTALRASDDRPFFLYVAHHAMHGPLGAKPGDLAKYRGRYDSGWDDIRQHRFARQLAAGLFPPDTPLPGPEADGPFAVPPWASLDSERQALFARYMEVYAAMVDNVDQNLGRLLSTVEALGELDNTIVVFTSDNGGTAEGGPAGTRSYFSGFVFLRDLPPDWERDVTRDPDLIGGPRTMVHYPRGWGRMSNTPFRFYKGQTFAGGVRVPFLLSWPAGLSRAAGDDGVRRQYQYVTDLAPTLLELAGIATPQHRQGQPAQQRDGSSFATVLVDPVAVSTHREQYAEFGGDRGFYRDGWKIVTNHPPGTPYQDGEWQLYHVDSDPTETRNLAATHPDRLRELACAWEHAAWANTVFPLDDGSGYLTGIRRPDEDRLARPVTLLPGSPKLERHRSARLIQFRSFTIDIHLTQADGDQGVLVAHGDQGGGYLVYVEGGRLWFAYNAYGRLSEYDGGPLPSGEHRIRVEATALPEFRWSFDLSVDAEPVAKSEPQPMLLFLAPFAGIDVGVNRGGPVHWDLHSRHRSFRYTGRLHTVTYTPGEQAPYDPQLVVSAARANAHRYD